MYITKFASPPPLWYVQYVLSFSGDFPIFFNFFVRIWLLYIHMDLPNF